MSDYDPPIIETRREQIFPHLDTDDVERARRFGELRRFDTGEALASVGEIGIGLAVLLRGQVDVYRHDALGRRQHFFTFGPGAFLGELAQLAGRPSFGDAIAREPVEALIFSPDRMRALLIAEAGLGLAAHARADSAADANAASRRRWAGDRRARGKSRRAAARGLSQP
jgi:thioredoxin reductase (NADPH)